MGAASCDGELAVVNHQKAVTNARQSDTILENSRKGDSQMGQQRIRREKQKEWCAHGR